MAYRIEVKRSAEKALSGILNPHRRRIAAAIDRPANDPRPPSSVTLTGIEDAYRIRVGDYRIIYRIEDRILVVCIIRIDHRKDIYRRLR